MNALCKRVCWAILVVALVAGPAVAQADGPVTVQVMQVDQSRFPIIDVYVSVTDAAGQPVKNLMPADFNLAENDQGRALDHVSRAGEQGPVTAVLVIDKSGSMKNVAKMEAAQGAAIAFVRLMRPGDVTGVIAFDTLVTVAQSLTGDQAALVAAIQGIEPKGDTALRDALYAATEMLEPVTGRKAIIAVTDGMDNFSTRTPDELLTLVQEQGVSIYTIGLGDPAQAGDEDAGFDEAALKAIAAGSGGFYTFAPQPDDLRGLYELLSARIQNEYRLTYTSPNALRDGTRRTIAVKLETGAGPATVNATYNPGGVIPEVAPSQPTWPLFLILFLVLGLLLVLPAGIGWGRRLVAGKPEPAAEEPAPPKPRVRLTDEQADQTEKAKKPRAKRKRQK
ncbi:MAG: VWA domain-containing protein [Chloroflexi bacterium]|nr:VWA domain-containing protein [Chloroflexota bacterium]